MKLDDIAETLGALGQTVADLGGDRSALSATEAFLRAEADRKPADFRKLVKKAARSGLRLPRATEVRAGAAAETLAGLIDILEAAGAKDSALKTVDQIRDVFEQHSSESMQALAEALADERANKPAPTRAKSTRAKKKS